MSPGFSNPIVPVYISSTEKKIYLNANRENIPDIHISNLVFLLILLR